MFSMGLLNYLSRSLSPEREMVRVEREIDLAKERAQSDPENAEIWSQLGNLYLRIGLVGSASQAYQNTVSLYLQRKEQEKAFEVFRKLVLFNFFDLPKFERIFLDQGLRDQLAARYYEAAAQMCTTDELYAKDICRRILSIDPLHDEARCLLGVKEAAPSFSHDRVLSILMPQTKLLAYAPAQVMEPEPAVEERAIVHQDVIQDNNRSDAGEDIDELIRKSIKQQREMLELMETLLRKASADAATAGGTQENT